MRDAGVSRATMPKRRAIWLVGRRRLLADEHDREDGERDTGRRARTGPFSERNRRGHRHDDGTHRGDRRDDRHRADRERSIQQRHADASGDTGGARPRSSRWALGDDAGRKGSINPSAISPANCEMTTMAMVFVAARGQPAEKIGSAVERRRRERGE